MRERKWGWAVVLLMVGSAWALAAMFDVSTRGGEIYPPYSSLRADPMGAKVLHDSLAALPGYRVERSFQQREGFRPAAGAVVFVLGARHSAPLFADCLKWAAAGARVVVAFDPKEKEKRKSFPDAERVIFAGDSEWLSNEGLHEARQTQRVLELLGGRRHVIFEESHLGVVQHGSVGQLLRRYRLWGAAIVLLILAVLFYWRSTSSLLPAVEGAAEPQVLSSGEDALVSLVRGAIPAAGLAASALALWTRGGGMLKSSSVARRERVTRALSECAGPPLEAWNRAHETLKRHNT